jgi:NDP-4-keto-2,6-dideoxyhexose 3-C-methyltransferase
MQKVVHLREEFGEKKTKIITAISMFYDLDDPNGFLGDVAEALDKNGILVIQ